MTAILPNPGAESYKPLLEQIATKITKYGWLLPPPCDMKALAELQLRAHERLHQKSPRVTLSSWLCIMGSIGMGLSSMQTRQVSSLAVQSTLLRAWSSQILRFARTPS